MSDKWHYRIMQADDGTWGVHEVYCTEDGDLAPHSWTEQAVFAAGSDSIEEVQSAVRMMAGDAYRPPLSKIWRDDYLDRMADHEANRED
jgi:hypothetical protein